jgi:nucleoside-triphosphate--adenylate kinase
MDEGKLVPDSVMVNLVMEDATPYVEEGRSLLLDGFPRTLEQAESLDSVVNVDLVINLDIPTETIVERISDRWIHPPSGRVYSYSYKPPKVKGKDDVTGEPLVQRDDDKPSCVRNRLASYDKVSVRMIFFLHMLRVADTDACAFDSQVTSPLVNYYKDKGVLETFQGTESDKIYPSVKSRLRILLELS